MVFLIADKLRGPVLITKNSYTKVVVYKYLDFLTVTKSLYTIMLGFSHY